MRGRKPRTNREIANLKITKKINVKKILAVINATYAVAKRKPFFSQLHKLR